MKIFKISLLACIFLLSSSCATVKFYDSSSKKETGIKVYSAKPYILVEYTKIPSAQGPKKSKTPSEDSLTIKTSIIYLPDLVNPQYIKIKPGIGSNDLKLTMTDGILTSYGLTTNTKIPETITAATGLLTGLTSAVSSLATTSKGIVRNIETLTTEKVEKPDFELYEFIIDNDNSIKLRKVEIK